MDIALIIDEYLKDKRNLITENDSFSVEGSTLARWDFVNIPRPTQQEIEALASVVAERLTNDQAKQDKITKGKKAREICTKVLDLVAGFNLDRELTIEQITEMQTVFKQAEAALRAGRPTFAKAFINAIEPDEILVPESLKAECLELLSDY